MYVPLCFVIEHQQIDSAKDICNSKNTNIEYSVLCSELAYIHPKVTFDPAITTRAQRKTSSYTQQKPAYLAKSSFLKTA